MEISDHLKIQKTIIIQRRRNEIPKPSSSSGHSSAELEWEPSQHECDGS